MRQVTRMVCVSQWPFSRSLPLAILTVLILGLCMGESPGQSLAELAKKEKERRSQTATEGTPRVITERDLGSAGRLPAQVPAESEGEGTEAAAAAPASEPEEEKTPDESKTQDYWRKRVEAVQKKITELETELQSPEMNWGAGIRSDVNPIGQKNLSRRQEVEAQLQQARGELAAIQDEARRAGIPAGWVR